VIQILAVAIGAPLALLFAIWSGSRMLKNPGPSSGSNAFGGFDVFQPAREQASEDLESHRQQVSITPKAEDDDKPVRVDLDKNIVRIKRP
jgi:hypothetical protein